MALTDGDREWMEKRFTAIQQDSQRQWTFANNLNTELKLHIQASNSRHESPCTTAQVGMAAHMESHHNPTKKVKTFGIWAATAAAIGEAIHWLHKLFEK